MIFLMLLCISATLFAAQEYDDTRNAEAKTLMRYSENIDEMSCQVPLQTLQMAKGAIPERIHWLLQQDDTYLADTVTAEERSAALEQLEWQAHKNYTAWVREHDCGINSLLFCAVGCPALLGMALGHGGVGLAFGGVAGLYVGAHYQPDQTEIKQQIARLKAVQEKKQKTE